MNEAIDTLDMPDYIRDLLGYGLESKITHLMTMGQLPIDTHLRLSTIGSQAINTTTGRNLRNETLSNVINHAESASELNETSERLLRGKLPGVVLNFIGYDRHTMNGATRPSGETYYMKEDMIKTVMDRRTYEGKSLEHPFYDHRYWSEYSISSGIAHGVWRALLQRSRKEWLTDEGVQEFWKPAVSSTHEGTQLKIELDAAHAIMRRSLVTAAVFSDTVMIELYEEADDTGMAGIGPVGLQDMRSLLTEEHPELQD